ncbi:MAG: DNA repair protein RecO [Steroidobacteraceae bacterium]
MSGAARRVQLERAFLLHHHPWRDSSRILDLFTRERGRVTVFARAARRGGSALPAALQPFAEVLVSYSLRGEAGQLSGAERGGPAQRLTGDALMGGFYANELLVKLLVRHDPHPGLYDAYARLVGDLADAPDAPSRPLRLFEKRLLEELGWGLSLGEDAATGEPLEEAAAYRYRPDGGAERVDGVAEGTLIFSGASLRSLAREELADERSLADARRLLRSALDQALDGRPLRTREVMIAMRARGAPGV